MAFSLLTSVSGGKAREKIVHQSSKPSLRFHDLSGFPSVSYSIYCAQQMDRYWKAIVSATLGIRWSLWSSLSAQHSLIWFNLDRCHWNTLRLMTILYRNIVQNHMFSCGMHSTLTKSRTARKRFWHTRLERPEKDLCAAVGPINDDWCLILLNCCLQLSKFPTVNSCLISNSQLVTSYMLLPITLLHRRSLNEINCIQVTAN